MSSEHVVGEPRIVHPVPVKVRLVWPREDTHFTPWLADNLDWLENLGIGRLTKVGVEVQVPGVERYLDALAETDGGTRVAIENQYAETDHDHLTRALAYAVGLKATALVVIAEHHRPEFVAVADYLNEAREALGGDRGIAVFLVQLSVEQVGEYRVPRFEVLSRPNTWLEDIQGTDGSVVRYTDVDTFCSAVPADRRDAVREIIDDWLDRPDTDTLVKSTVSLRALNPYVGDTRMRSFFLLEASGTLVIQRGYLIDTGAFTDPDGIDQLDAQIDQHFPDLSYGARRYYPSTTTATPAAVRAFADWLFDYLDSAPGEVVAAD